MTEGKPVRESVSEYFDLALPTDANGLGNLASRTLTMINQYRGGVIPSGSDLVIIR